MEFEWDEKKAQDNFQKHGVRFSEAATLWSDELAIDIHDSVHSLDEDQWIRIGISILARFLVVVFVEKVEGEKIRIISARKARGSEFAQYKWGKR